MTFLEKLDKALEKKQDKFYENDDLELHKRIVNARWWLDVRITNTKLGKNAIKPNFIVLSRTPARVS